MKSKRIRLYMGMLVFLFLTSQSVYAAGPLCLKKGFSIENIIKSVDGNIGGYYEICPWYYEKMEKQRIRREDLFSSALGYMLWKNLKNSRWSKDRESAWGYIGHSIYLASKQGITSKDYFAIMNGIYSE